MKERFIRVALGDFFFFKLKFKMIKSLSERVTHKDGVRGRMV